jgi:hypothetical protein
MDNLLDFVNDKCLIEIRDYDDFKKNLFDKLIIELKDFNLDMYDEYSYTSCYKYLNFVINSEYSDMDGLFVFLIGCMYKNGEYFKQDYQEAIKYYKMAIGKGNDYAMFSLGGMYHYGIGIERNYTEAIKYYKIAIVKGNGHAMNAIGWMYHNGTGLRKNYYEAIKYYKMAYEKGNDSAMNNLGNMYCNGEGIKRDYHEAVKYYKMAIGKGVSYAMNSFYNMYNDRYYLSVDIRHKEAIEYCKIYINAINDESEIIKTMDKMFKINQSINNSGVYIDLINLCNKFKLDDYKMKIMKYILKNSTIKRLREMIKYISCYEKLEDICSKNKMKILRLLLADEQEQFYTNVICDLSTTVNRYTSAEIFSFI